MKDNTKYKVGDHLKVWKKLSDGTTIYKFELEEEPKAVWDTTDMQEVKFEDELRRHPTFERCFDQDYNMSKQFTKTLKKLAFGNIENHFCIECIGRQGGGKSRGMMALARSIFGWDCLNMKTNLSFTYNDTLQKIKQHPKEPFIIQDEQPRAVGLGVERESYEISNLIECSRIRKKCLFFISPSSRHHHGIHYHLKVLQKSIKYRLLKIAIMDHYKAGYGYTYEYSGWIVVKIPTDAADPFYKNQYLPQKKKFVDNILTRDLGRVDFEKTSDELRGHPLFAAARTRSDLTDISRLQHKSWTEQEHKANVEYLRKVKFKIEKISLLFLGRG